GMPDEWELRYGFDPNDPSDGSGDADGDVYTNVEEYLNGTDPLVATSGHSIARSEPVVQAGNDALRFGVARKHAEPERYDPAARTAFADAVRASGRDVAAYVGLEFVAIEPGRFDMPAPVEKSSSPFVGVTLTRPYEMGVTEVTQAQWTRVMGTTAGTGRPGAIDSPDHPATYVSYDDAQEFLARLSAAGDATYRLPTDAEWEWAWLGGAPRPNEQELAELGWHEDNTVDVGLVHPQPVAQRTPNHRGIHDLVGNVHEWCQDYWYYWYWREGGEKVDPTGGTEEMNSHGYRVVRGGSFYMSPLQLSRYPSSIHRPAYRSFEVGFRVVRER